jgi:hypothetical protein
VRSVSACQTASLSAPQGRAEKKRLSGYRRVLEGLKRKKEAREVETRIIREIELATGDPTCPLSSLSPAGHLAPLITAFETS